MADFSERIRELRKQRNITQVKLGEVLSYGYTVIADYETGKREPSCSDLCRLADYFNVSVDYLIGYTDRNQNNE